MPKGIKFKTDKMHIKEIDTLRDGGTISFRVIVSVDEREKLDSATTTTIITIDAGMNGDGKWYSGLKSLGSPVIEDVDIKIALIKAFEKKINHETILLENVKQFL